MNKKETLEISIYAESNPADDINRLDVKAKAECTLNFLASALSALMKNDEQLREAMHLAVLEDLLGISEVISEKINKKKDLSDIDELIRNIKAKA